MPCMFWGRRWWQTGPFFFFFSLLQEGSVSKCPFFPLHTQLVAPCWLLFVLKSRGKGSFCQCLPITHSNMTPWNPFTEHCGGLLSASPARNGKFIPRMKVAFFACAEALLFTRRDLKWLLLKKEIVKLFSYFSLLKMTACPITYKILLHQYKVQGRKVQGGLYIIWVLLLKASSP